METYYRLGYENWRAKATGRRLELKVAKQLLRETKAGRERWRGLYEESQSELAAAHRRIAELEAQLKKN